PKFTTRLPASSQNGVPGPGRGIMDEPDRPPVGGGSGSGMPLCEPGMEMVGDGRTAGVFAGSRSGMFSRSRNGPAGGSFGGGPGGGGRGRGGGWWGGGRRGGGAAGARALRGARRASGWARIRGGVSRPGSGGEGPRRGSEPLGRERGASSPAGGGGGGTSLDAR